VASAAEAGELLMTERTREASAEVRSIALTARGTRRLKGLPEHALFGEAEPG
jgi:class 3 adenylate cyclase